MNVHDGKRGERRRPGFPVNALLIPFRPILGQGMLRRLPGVLYRLPVLAVLGIATAAAFHSSRTDGYEAPVPPQVADLAPTLYLPVDVNDRVERWMRRFLTDLRPDFELYLAREGLYAEMIRDALRERDLPEDLIYLAAIESAFSPVALSSDSASGIWQFMGPTAQQFGLRIDEYVDERRDPVRATEAALDYLQALHGQFGSWYLAAAAYNAGPGRVAQALKYQPTGEVGDETIYWDIIEHLPLETREYVPKILAAILLSRAAETYGFHLVERATPVHFDRVWVPGGTSLTRVAQSMNLPSSRLRELNPHLVRGVTPPGGMFPLRVPPGESARIVAAMGGRWRTIAVDD
jgi:membrane-bound lytic murein transglycosylase D